MNGPFNYARFNKRPPGKKPPPKNFIDLRHDPDTGGFVFEDDQGVETAVGGTDFSTNKASLADGDKVAILDSAASDAPKHSLWSLVKSTLKTYFDTLYAAVTHTHTSSEVTDIEGWLAANGIVYDPAITGLTGGGATKLDGIATEDLAVGRLQTLVVSGVLSIYQLAAGTTAESSPSVIRPDDYVGSTNEKIWNLVGYKRSTGGNGSADAGKLVVFGTNGEIQSITSASSTNSIYGRANGINGNGVYGLASNDSGSGVVGWCTGALGYGVYAANSDASSRALYALATAGTAFEVEVVSGSIFKIDADKSVTIESTTAENFRTALGIPTYADLTAANAALNAGDIYFDTALNILRSATA